MLRKFFTGCLLFAVLLSGCAKNPASPTVPAKSSGGFLQVSSDAFPDGGSIPVEYSCDGKNINPTVQWSKVPEKTRSIALIVTDPDAPGGTFTHWVVYNIPPIMISILPGLPKDDKTFAQGMNSFNETGYGGPCPPKGQEHRYFFMVYALDLQELPTKMTSTSLEKAIQGHILAQGQLMGKFKR